MRRKLVYTTGKQEKKKMKDEVHDVSKRLLIESALFDYARLANISEADIDELYRSVEQLNSKCFEDEKAFDTVTKYNLDSIKSKEDLKKRIESMRSQIVEKVFSYYDKNTYINGEKIAVVLNDIGVKQSLANELSRKIMSHQLHENMTPEEEEKFSAGGKRSKSKKAGESVMRWADKLALSIKDRMKALQKNLQTDLQTYDAMEHENPLIAERLPLIRAHVNNKSLTLNYKTRNTDEDKKFRRGIRDDFSKDGGAKNTVLKIVGLLAENGKNRLKNSSDTSNYDSFKKLMIQYYGDKAQSVIDTALGVNGAETDIAALQKERLNKYNQKSEEMYVKLAVSLTSLKRADKSGRGDILYSVYVETIENTYISSLRKGLNNVKSLCFVDQPDDKYEKEDRKRERELGRQFTDDTAEKQIVSVHHHLPVAAASDVCDKFFKDTPDKLAAACGVVNTVGNLSLVIGRDKHQSMEARGNYELKKSPAGMIFASRLDWEKIDEISGAFPSYLKKGMEKYLKHQKGDSRWQDISVSMKFPESETVAEQRRQLNSGNEISMNRLVKNLAEPEK